MRYLTVLIACLAAITAARSQTLKSFSSDKATYYKEISSLFEAVDQALVIDFLQADFKPVWDKLGKEDEKFVYEVSNLFLKKRLKPEPHYRQFLGTLIEFSNGKGGSNFSTWKTTITELAGGKSKAGLEDYLEAVYLLLHDGKLYSTSTINWSVSGSDFTLVNDSMPGIAFRNITLTGAAKDDHTNLYEATGTYYPVIHTWYGSKGKITWERAGLAAARNFATFADHRIRISSTFYDVPEATLTTQYYPQPLRGKLREKFSTSVRSADVDFPVFESATKDVRVPEIVRNVDFYGGFSLKGDKFSGTGDPTQPSKLVFKLKDKAFLEATALDILFDSAKVVAPMARVVIRLGKDSIIHSGLKLRYDKARETVELFREENSGSTGPLYSSYHELDFFVQQLSWKNGDTLINLGNLKGSANNKASFESNNFFVEDRYKALQFPGGQHPLVVLRNFSYQNRTKDFPVQDFAAFINADVNAAKQFVIDLSEKGFLYYDLDQEYVTLKDKLFDFLLANQKKIDYDVILFTSDVKNSIDPNAVLNINTYDLDIYGVRQISLSDSQQVSIFTDHRTPYIRVKKNRNMEFAGVLKAGGFDFYGDSFRFDYDKFKVELLKVDSVILYVMRVDSEGKFQFVPVKTKINDITGELYIDNPINKSGLDTINNKEFPILKTNENSFAYYDKEETYKGIYNREKFFFRIDPFDLDSLDNFNEKVLNFKGTLVSDGIFPDFVDSLRIMDDYSLGFRHSTPPEGLVLYGEKARFTNEIRLSDKGLKGDGDIVYVTSTSSSKNFNFFPDSTTGIAQKVINVLQASGPDVPDFSGSDFDFKLDPRADQLLARSLKQPFEMFNREARKSGLLVLTPAALRGAGELALFDGKVRSDGFRYNSSNAFADTAAFELNSLDNSGLAIATDKVSAQVDFNYRVATFKALQGNSKISFPKNQYIAYMDTYKWLIDEKKIELSSSIKGEQGQELGSRFFSVHPDQDSLNFIVPRAVYDIKDYVIRCMEVENILIADALVHPSGGNVNILPSAIIETLQDATITADYINRFHTIFNATVEVISAHKYLGRGTYNYEDDLKNKQQIKFENIEVDTGRHTVAVGKIPESQNFKLNQFFDYRGDVKLRAQDKGLFFTGSTRIMTNCDIIESYWLAFSGQVDPKDVLIPVGDKMKNDLGEDLAAGIMLNIQDSAVVYPAFISKKITPGDPQITTALGYLWYNRDDQSYNIGSKERFEKKSKAGNLVTLNTQTCDITANGSLSFGADLGQVKTSLTGNAVYNYKKETTELSGFMLADFMFDRKMLEYMVAKAANYPFLQPVNISTTQFEKAVLDLAGAKTAAEVSDDLAKKGVMDKVPAALSASLAFADVKFEWDDETSSFVSVGNIGISNVLDKNLMIYVKGKIQVLRSRRGNELVIYLEYDPDTWYFFKYKMDDRPRMQFYSSDAEFMKLFEAVKEKDRKKDTKKGEPGYEIELGPRSGKDSFFERFDP